MTDTPPGKKPELPDDSRIGEARRYVLQYHVKAAKLRVEELFPGVLAAITVAIAATFLADHYGAPVMLFALLLGMAFRFISEEGRGVAGVQFSSRYILRVGVALLGMRITVEQIMSLGPRPVANRVTGLFGNLLGEVQYNWLMAELKELTRWPMS